MAWSTTRIDYDRADSSLQVLIGLGGAPNVATKSARAIAVRTDATDPAAMLYATVDSGTTWEPVAAGGGSPVFAGVRVEADVTAGASGITVADEELTVRTAPFTLEDVDVTLADEAGVVAYGSVKLCDLPDGLVCIIGAVADLVVTKSSAGVNDDWDGDFGLGSAQAGNDATLGTTEQNVIPSTATPQAVAGATTAKGVTATAGATLDGTASAVSLYLNFLVDDADHDVGGTPCNLVLNGTVRLSYIALGDYA